MTSSPAVPGALNSQPQTTGIVPLRIVPASHVDHGLTSAQIEHVTHLFAGRDSFFIETVTLPNGLGTVPCGLHNDVGEEEVFYAKRGDRAGESRLCRRPPQSVRTVTVIAGPDGDDLCVLYTMFGGPAAPREPWDSSLTPEQLEESRAFWATHALSAPSL